MQNKTLAMRWANDTGFLMERLKASTHAHVFLKCLSENWEFSDDWDQTVLGIEPNLSVFHREIIMKAGDLSCWYARTIIPETTYTHEAALFQKLNTLPLGALIWSHPTVSRAELVTYEITPQSLEYSFIPASDRQNAPCLQARYSVILFDCKYPLYLLEIFLPDLFEFKLL